MEKAIAQERGEFGNEIDWRVAGVAENLPLVLELTPSPQMNVKAIDSMAFLAVPATMDGIRFWCKSRISSHASPKILSRRRKGFAVESRTDWTRRLRAVPPTKGRQEFPYQMKTCNALSTI